MVRDKWQIPSHWPLIKICGLTRPNNALACARAGADAIGLVFFEKSPRSLSMDQALAITRILPPQILCCGVFVDESFERIMDRVDGCGLKGVQLHGNESPALVAKLAAENLVVIKTLFATKTPFLAQADLYPSASFLLVEQGGGRLPGGNAKVWDYGLCDNVNLPRPMMLAGGLCCENIQEAIGLARPRAVDISSGVEKTPGLKDMEKVKTFIRLARSWHSPGRI